MWVLLAPSWAERAIGGTTSQGLYRSQADEVIAYYGSYSVVEATNTVVHHVEASSHPRFFGRALMRRYVFANNTLVLSFDQAQYTLEATYERL
jgi:hypothetical protein